MKAAFFAILQRLLTYIVAKVFIALGISLLGLIFGAFAFNVAMQSISKLSFIPGGKAK